VLGGEIGCSVSLSLSLSSALALSLYLSLSLINICMYPGTNVEGSMKSLCLSVLSPSPPPPLPPPKPESRAADRALVLLEVVYELQLKDGCL
jgi:hypothetical protein